MEWNRVGARGRLDSRVPDRGGDRRLEEDETADTTLYKNDLTLSYDSIKNWRNLKEYGYTKYLDSLLKNQKNKSADNSNTKNAVRTISFLDRLFNASFLKILLWMLAICFIGIILKNLVFSLKNSFSIHLS